LGVSFFENSRSRQWSSIFGNGILTGHTASQRPHSVDALGSGPVSSMPIRLGDSTAPIGPG
jgi:hypothetical protein